MIDRADVVVIGSGGFGASTAFHLAERGVAAGRWAREPRTYVQGAEAQYRHFYGAV
jgi:glycine/D-amino acid oxidase-like deaminating enzyme